MSSSIATLHCPCTEGQLCTAHSDVDQDTARFKFAHDTTGLQTNDLQRMDPAKLIAFGYAVEAKGNDELGKVVREVIKSRANETPWQTFRFAVAHGYLDIADEAAPYTIGRLPTKDQCIHDLDPPTQLAWYKYREQYLLLLDAVFTQPPPHKNTKRKLHNCGGWEAYAAYVLGDLPGTPLFDIMSDVAERGAGAVFGRRRWEMEIIPPGWDSECPTCRERAEKWESVVSRRFRRLELFGTIFERVKSGSGNG